MSLEQFYKRYKWTIYLAIILCWLVFIVFLGQPLREGKSKKEKREDNKKQKGAGAAWRDVKKRGRKIRKGIKKVSSKAEEGIKKAAAAVKCEADKVAIKGIDGAIKAVEEKYKMPFQFCFFPLNIRSHATGSCGVKETNGLIRQQLKIREDNKKCFKKWFDKQKEKEEKKDEEAKNSYLPKFTF